MVNRKTPFSQKSETLSTFEFRFMPSGLVPPPLLNPMDSRSKLNKTIDPTP